ncbi:MAG: nuclear transport factor 2 family protein [Actinomycetes bacterium]
MRQTPMGNQDHLKQEEVRNAATQLVSHFAANNVKAYFECFSQDANFIFYTHSVRLNSRQEYEELWKSWEDEIDFKVLSCTSTNQDIRMVGQDVGIFTHSVLTTLSTSDGTDTVAERETIVFEKQGLKWVAIHEHLSPDPTV